ncbi:MAG: glycosyltransferase family 4 protein [Candidatus Methanomethylicia archaeon]
MRIAFTTEFFVQGGDGRIHQAGGGERRCYEICKALARMGHEIHVYCHEHRNGLRGLTHEGIYIHRLGIHTDIYHYGRRIFYILDLLRSTPNLLKFDVLNTTLFLPATPTYFIGRLRNSPVTLMVDDLFTWDIARGNLPIHAALACMTSQFLNSLLDFDAIFVPTQAVKEKLSRFGYPKHRIHVTYNGVDLEFFDNVPSQPIRDQIIVISRLIPYKGVHHIIDVYNELKNEYKDIPPLTIIGSYEGYPLYSMIKDKALKSGCRFLGFIPDNFEVVRQLKHSLINILFSDFEGFGLTIVEAAACSTPSIVKDIPACREVMEKLGLEELLVKDKKELKEKMIDLLTDDEKRRKLGEKARRNVEKYFTWNKAAEQMVEAWRKIINSPL